MQRLPNGNTLISYGDLQPANIVFVVVDSLQNKVFELSFPDTLITYRTFNYPTLPWSLNRPEITCFKDSGRAYLDAGAGHASYRWSTGDSTQIIAVNDTGAYYVFVPKGDGGFIRSEKLIVPDTSGFCSTTALAELIIPGHLQIYPNPGDGPLQIVVPDNCSATDLLEIFDLAGVMIHRQEAGNNRILHTNLRHLKSGIYFIRINQAVTRYIKM